MGVSATMDCHLPPWKQVLSFFLCLWIPAIGPLGAHIPACSGMGPSPTTETSAPLHLFPLGGTSAYLCRLPADSQEDHLPACLITACHHPGTSSPTLHTTGRAQEGYCLQEDASYLPAACHFLLLTATTSLPHLEDTLGYHLGHLGPTSGLPPGSGVACTCLPAEAAALPAPACRGWMPPLLPSACLPCCYNAPPVLPAWNAGLRHACLPPHLTSACRAPHLHRCRTAAPPPPATRSSTC